MTFEISSGESNDTKGDEENASIPGVPIFKGTRGGSSNANNIDSDNNQILSVLPLESTPPPPNRVNQRPYPSGVPQFYPSFNQHDGYRERYGGGPLEERNDGWNALYPQYEIWTTERNQRRFEHHPRPPSAFHPPSNNGGKY